MPWGLKRYYGTGGLHYITWSCHERRPLLGTVARRNLVLTVLELMRDRYRFAVVGYVVMPEHVHLVISEPFIGNPSKVIQACSNGFRSPDPDTKSRPHHNQGSRRKTTTDRFTIMV